MHKYIGADYSRWDERNTAPDDVWTQIEEWAAQAMAAREERIRYATTPKTIMVVDACESGWGALVCRTDGPVTMAAGLATTRTWRSSSVSEPWGWYQAMQALALDGESILVLTDNEALCHCINKGYSRSWHYNECIRRVGNSLPNTRVAATHIGGVSNPADEPSRGVESTGEKLEEFAKLLQSQFSHLDIAKIMERKICGLNGRTFPYRIGITPLGVEMRNAPANS
jgi:hypothetical protein